MTLLDEIKACNEALITRTLRENPRKPQVEMILFENKTRQTLHAHFEGIVNVFRGKSNKENCTPMSLGASLKISASLG